MSEHEHELIAKGKNACMFRTTVTGSVEGKRRISPARKCRRPRSIWRRVAGTVNICMIEPVVNRDHGCKTKVSGLGRWD